MKMKDIINNLFEKLPLCTNYFTDEIPVTAITSVGLVANVETSTPHGLITGKYANISGSVVPNNITSLTSSNGIASATTLNNHDLRMALPNGILYVDIIDADQSEYNGTHELLSVPNRKNFTFKIDGTPASPATGTPKLLENLKYGYNGWHQITKIDDDNFTYPLIKNTGSPAQGSILCRVTPRISGAVSIERALEAYTKQSTDKLWAFVVLGNRSANKDRQVVTDATSSPGIGEAFRQLIIQTFDVYVVTPTKDEIAARKARDLGEDILAFLCSSLLRIRLTSVFSQPPYSSTVFSGDSFGFYENAYYVHTYTFESTEYITYDDTVNSSLGVAFLDMDVDYKNEIGDNVIMTDSIDLDDIPL